MLGFVKDIQPGEPVAAMAEKWQVKLLLGCQAPVLS